MSKLKQLEISFVKDMTKKYAVETPKTAKPAKISKAEGLKRAASKSKRMTDWLVGTSVKELEWDDDPDLPELEEIALIEKREIERVELERERGTMICTEMVEGIIAGVEAASVVGSIVTDVLESSWSSYKMEVAWSMVKEDQEVMNRILTKIREMEESRISVLENDRSGQEKQSIQKEQDYIMLEEDRKEHAILDSILEETGVVIETENKNWEESALEELDDILGDQDHDREDKLEDTMRIYLENTNLLSKRMVSATLVVNTHLSESGLMLDGQTDLFQNGTNEISDIMSGKYISHRIGTDTHDIMLDGQTVLLQNGTNEISDIMSGRYISHRIGTDTHDIPRQYESKMSVSSSGLKQRCKRALDDDGSWWLEPSWRCRRRPGWPSSSSSRRLGGTGTLQRRTDSLINKSNNNKTLWKSLNLTGNTVQFRTSSTDWSWVHGADGGYEQHRGGAEARDDQGEGGGRGEHVGGAGTQGGGGESGQVARLFVKGAKNVRVQKRDNRRQLSISNYTRNFQNSLGGGSWRL